MRSLVLGALAMWWSGCATSQGATSLAMERFPKREVLQQVALRQPKLDVARLSAHTIDSWTLKGPLPTHAAVTHVAPATPWERALAADAPAFGAALSEELRCIARETAHYYLARGEHPGNALSVFIERRCGTTAPHTRLYAVKGELPEDVADDTWLMQWRADLQTQLKTIGTPTLSGVAALREKNQAVLVLAWATHNAEFSAPLPLVSPGRTVTVRGRLTRGSAARIDALINRGTLDVATCKTLDVVKPPEFAFECPVDPADERTTLALAAFQPGRIFGDSIGDFTLWPAGQPKDTWQRPVEGSEVPKGEFNTRFLGAVNQFRQRAKLPMLTEAKGQSATAASLTEHFFAAQLGEADAVDADVIVLGLLAGWDVGVDIVSAGFGSQWLTGSRDLSVFLDFVLDNPFQRKALTEPRAKLISIGSIDDADHALAALFTTYVPLGTFDRTQSEVSIITRLNTLRRDRGLGLAQWTLWPEDEGAKVAARLSDRSWTPDQALQHALTKTAAVARGAVRGTVQLVDNLDNFQFPTEVLMRPDINVFLAVGTYRDEEWAQTRYVVCFVVAHNRDIETAAR